MATCDNSATYRYLTNHIEDWPTSTTSSSSTYSSSTSSSYVWATYAVGADVHTGDVVTRSADGTVAPARPGDAILGCAAQGTTCDTSSDSMYFLNEGNIGIWRAGETMQYTLPIPAPPPPPEILMSIDSFVDRDAYCIVTRDPDGGYLRREVSTEYLREVNNRDSAQDRLRYMAEHQRREHQQQCIERRQQEAQQLYLDPYQEIHDVLDREMERACNIRAVPRGDYQMGSRGDYQMGIDHAQQRRLDMAYQNPYPEMHGVAARNAEYVAHAQAAAQQAAANDGELSYDGDERNYPYQKMREKRDKAEQRAQELLGNLIGGSELDIYKRTGKLWVKGLHGDYIIQKDGFIKHLKGGRVLDICCHLKDKDKMPATDNVIAMKLRLENEEDNVLKMANTHRDQSREEYEAEEGGFPEVACM